VDDWQITRLLSPAEWTMPGMAFSSKLSALACAEHANEVPAI
jgi:hypothetical protein